MSELRHHDHNTRPDRCIVQAPLHCKHIRQFRELAGKPFTAMHTGKTYPNEKPVVAYIAELGAIKNIATAIGQESSHRVNDAGAIQARQEQNKFFTHGFHKPLSEIKP
jgi:hypothetical protein